MSLEVIYVARMGWVVDMGLPQAPCIVPTAKAHVINQLAVPVQLARRPVDWDYTGTVPSPTGIAADPALAAHGVEQAKELATALQAVDPPIEAVFSSPYYTAASRPITPFIDLGRSRGGPATAATDAAATRGSRGQRATKNNMADTIRPELAWPNGRRC